MCVFSLAELEHCVLRSEMSRPKVHSPDLISRVHPPPHAPPSAHIATRRQVLLSGIFVPSTRYDFALQRRDIRLLWALNCGSPALLSGVPVYRPTLLDAQLDAVTRLSVPRLVHVLSARGRARPATASAAAAAAGPTGPNGSFYSPGGPGPAPKRPRTWQTASRQASAAT